MTTYKKGDRVRVTIEGVVIRDQSTQEVFLSADKAAYPAHHVVNPTKPGVTIEKLADPLPTTPGSVIVGKVTGYARLLHYGGLWYGRGGPALRPDDLNPADWDVLHYATEVER